MSEKKTLLLVDDEQIILDSLGRELKEEGFEVTRVDCAEDALDKLKKKTFDFVVTDLVMPGLDGFQVLKEAKRNSPDTSVIILTGYGNMVSAVDALRLGADDFLQKPCDLEELLFRLTNCLTRQELLRKVTMYESILPICSYCKKIRDDRGQEKGQGTWLSVEAYFHKKKNINFSHGCCQECYEKEMKNLGILKK